VRRNFTSLIIQFSQKLKQYKNVDAPQKAYGDLWFCSWPLCISFENNIFSSSINSIHEL